MLSRDVHVWRISLDTQEIAQEKMISSLSLEEHLRYQALVRADVRHRYIVSHYALREILGKYLNKPSCDVQFSIQERGKPMLAQTEERDLHFNLSHSGNLALCAVAAKSAVGVDVERIREIRRLDDLVTRFFNPQEIAMISSCPTEEKQRKFFELWTKKEAYLKGTGCGLLGGSEPSEGFWKLFALEVQTGYCGALAVQASEILIRYFDWAQ